MEREKKKRFGYCQRLPSLIYLPLRMMNDPAEGRVCVTSHINLKSQQKKIVAVIYQHVRPKAVHKYFATLFGWASFVGVFIAHQFALVFRRRFGVFYA